MLAAYAHTRFLAILISMIQKQLLVWLSILLYIITFLHLLALYFFWYWSIWWYDIPMHFFGGLWVGGMAFLVYRYVPAFSRFRGKHRLYAYVVPFIAVLAVGGLWEVFEFGLDTFITLEQNDVLDTISDIGMDTAGALLAILYAKMKRI